MPRIDGFAVTLPHFPNPNNFTMRNRKEECYLVPELVLVRKNIPTNPVKVSTSHQAHRVFLSMWERESLHVEEHFCILLLDRNRTVIGFRRVAQGSINRVDVDITKIVKLALVANADSVIIAHNHPSDIPLPSAADKVFTVNLRLALQQFEIQLADHLILWGTELYTSFKDQRIAF
jgi:DNA repair protein RadC